MKIQNLFYSIIIVVFAFTFAAASMMSKNFYCKWCGSKHATVQNLTLNNCSKNPNGKKHELYDGPEQSEYTCKYCGTKSKTIQNLTLNNCSKSPTKKHEAYEGAEKSEYTCKYCGSKHKTIQNLTLNNCSKSPTKKHQPAL
jgi:ribosomal protein S14